MSIIMPCLYPATAESFNSNGLGVLAEALSCTVTEERNGAYELSMTYPISGRRYNDIAQRCIITAPPAPGKAPQPFRIYQISRPMRGKITINAQHISYDLNGVPVAPFTAPSAASAMAYLRNNALISKPFTFWTDIQSSADMQTLAPMAVRSIIGGTEGSILDTYGGELEWDGYQVKLWKQRGANNGVSIRYGKNLIDLQQEENISSVYTGVCPYYLGSDGKLITVPGDIVPAPGSFDFTNILTLDLSSEFEEAPSPEALLEYTQSYITTNKISTPSVSISVDFAQLVNMSGYEQIAPLESVYLCDTVNVLFPALGIDSTAEVVSTTFDVLKGKYSSVTVGSLRPNIADTIADTSQAVQDSIKVSTSISYQAIKSATEQITGQTGGNLVTTFNAQGKPNGLMIMDTDDMATAQNVWRWNLGGLGHSSNGINGPYGTAITQDGMIVADYILTGNLVSEQVTVAGFNLSATALKNGMTSLDDTAHAGVYVGTDGIALGAGAFKVDANGHLTATSGTFSGNVYASSIITEAQAAGAGYIQGSQVGSSTLTGGNVASYTLASGNLTTAVNGYIAQGTTAYDKVTNITSGQIQTYGLSVYGSLTTNIANIQNSLIFGGSNIRLTPITINGSYYVILAAA